MTETPADVARLILAALADYLGEDSEQVHRWQYRISAAEAHDRARVACFAAGFMDGSVLREFTDGIESMS